MQSEPIQEETVWEGSPSQVLNLGIYLLCILFCFLVVPLFWAIWRWIELRSVRYVLTTERLRVTHGVFNRRVDDIELYRVRDTALSEPFILRLFSLGNIEVSAADATSPVTYLRGIHTPDEVRNKLRRQIEVTRRRHGVRTLDGLEGLGTQF
jgi:uncharacterized membrane protein YdbT with pleckstrin-like domain